MLSILITAFREAGTVGRAIERFLPQLPPEAEILVASPDPETIKVVDNYAACYPAVLHVADPQRGKPTAVNAGLKAARGETVVLSDGDVAVDENALAPLLAPFDDPQVGGGSGHPLSISPRDTLLGVLVASARRGDSPDEAGA
ncbi:MAG: hypothetical protein DRI77_01880 [Chloroflexi bacterium]|nr:MAG: hypothetical protein DRI77_01880 [Chloroflexota bacterium]